MHKVANNPCYKLPVNLDVPIWRYMDFTKYISCLETKALFFSRADELGDPYEGAISHYNKSLSKNASAFRSWIRQWTYINCWHMNEHESAAMWKLYTKSSDAIVLKSTCRQLCAALPNYVYVGVVNYIDYENEAIPEDNTHWPYVHKRKSFDHERELRASFHDVPSIESKIDMKKVNSVSGKLVPVNLNSLVESVLISPESPQWFTALVADITKRYGYNFNVSQSSLDKGPVF